MPQLEARLNAAGLSVVLSSESELEDERADDVRGRCADPTLDTLAFNPMDMRYARASARHVVEATSTTR